MSHCPIERVTRMLIRSREVLDQHAADCCEQVLAFALNPADHEAMMIVELWGVPVLGWEKVEKGRLSLLCESNGVLIPHFESLADILDVWKHQPAPRGAETLSRKLGSN